MRLRGVLLCLALLSAMPAAAMDFGVYEIPDPVTGLAAYRVFATGDIVPGDADGILAALEDAGAEEGDRIEVYFHSPGGSVGEGINLGRVLNALGAITNVGQRAKLPTRVRDGICASACVFSYLGGSYRLLADGSELGVHQFYFTDTRKLTATRATSVTQEMAAEIVEFIEENGADTSFFRVMTSTRSDDILFVPHDTLAEMRVVTGAIRGEEWTFENAGGLANLRIWQDSLSGENKLVLGCEGGGLVVMASLHPPFGSFESADHAIGLYVDGELELIPAPSVIAAPALDGEAANASFRLPAELSERLLTAESIGAGIKEGDAPPFGFQIATGPGREKLATMIESCK
jgi:hypothetical protein